MNKGSRRVMAGLALVAAVAVGLTGCLGRAGSGGTGDISPDDLYVVETRDVSAGTSVSGTVHPAHLASLSVLAQGTVTAVNVVEGDSVHKGDVLVQVDDRAQQNQVAQAESRYRAAVASLGVTRLSGLSQTKAQLQSALTQAQAQQVSAQVNLRNFTDKDTSALQISNLQEQVANAEASLRSAQNSLKSLQDYDTSALQVTVADFSVDQAQLSLQMAQTRLAVLQSRDVTTAQLAQLQSQVSQAKIGLDTAKLNLKEAAQAPTTSDDRLAILQEQVDQAQATLNLAQLNLKNASADSRASQSDIDLQRMQVQSSQVSLSNAEANYQVAVAGAAQKKLQIASAQEQVNQARSALTIAQNNLASTQKTNDARANDLETLNAQVKQADAAVALAQSNLSAFADTEQRTTLQLQSAQEQLNQATLALSAQKLLLDNYVITAPWDGTVLAVNVNVGDMVTPQSIVVKMGQTSTWNVEAYVDEVDILNIRNEQEAQVTIDSYPDQDFAGKVSYLGRTLVRTPEGLNAYALKIRLTTPPATLVDGMSGDATIILSTAKGVLAVPVESLLIEGGKKYVTLVKAEAGRTATQTKTEITTGLEGDEYVEVTSGLKAGDTILRQQPIATTTIPGSPFSGGN
ncbi:MAG: efflux RND transporter periplasmic adaptor subunit [Candidatus Cryosericum sp.]|nr:efflux RND transporter periplasmic adaptor subunit [bacterium]